MEWLSYWLARPPSPLVYTIIAIGFMTFAVWPYFRVRPLIDSLKLGIRGERIVGRALDDLRKLSYRVFHDIPGEGSSGAFNIDHLLIGPAGVFVVETKTVTKAGRGNPQVGYYGPARSGRRTRAGSPRSGRSPIMCDRS